MSTFRSPSEFRLPSDSDASPALQLFRAPIVLRYLGALVMTALATIVAIGLDSTVTIPNLSLIFVVPVIIAAVAFGLGPSLFSAVLAALAFNFFFAPPLYTLTIDDPSNIWAMGLLFAVGAIASAVASTARRKADDAALAVRQTAAVQAYSRNILSAGDTQAITALTADTLEALFQVPAVVMLMSGSSVETVERRGKIELRDAEIEAARSALANSTIAVADTYPFDTSRFDFWPVMPSSGSGAVIGLAFDQDERPTEPGILVEIVANLLALALDQRHLRDASR